MAEKKQDNEDAKKKDSGEDITSKWASELLKEYTKNLTKLNQSKYWISPSGTVPSSGWLSPSGSVLSSGWLPPSTWITSPEEEKLEDKIVELRKENRRLVQEATDKSEALSKKEIEIGELQKTIKQLQKNEEDIYKEQRLQYLLYRVNDNARRKLLESEEFRNRFEKSKQCSAVIISVDIRRSTELMLKAREPQLYANFITSLCAELTRIIMDNYGVFDKFTGDGILAFFPDFYSGENASYLAIKAADECHNYFSKHYEANRSCFSSVLTDVGLGIGIDYGLSHLVRLQDGLTVIGTPVVYACRMSVAKAGQTLLNQPAYEVTSQKFGEYVNFQETEIDIKNEGNTLAYLATLSKKIPKIKPPDWLEAPGTRES
jgi:class 3 adenylate cyclase